MLPFLFVILIFAYCWLVGLGLLALLRAELSDLRVALTAPAIGTCGIVLIAFLFSEAGVSVGSCAVPIAIVLGVCSCAVLGVRRPRLHAGSAAVAGVCVAVALLTAWPMFTFGFHWFGNANDDMTNYVLSAQDLLKRGLLAPIDFTGLLTGRDYASVLTTLNLEGSRPGSAIWLAFAASVSGHSPYEIFMPVIVALDLCCACAAGALTLQFTHRWYAALLAAVLFLISPMASYAVLQQLLAQVWGLAVAAALLALLMRAELHEAREGATGAGNVIAIGILVAGLLLGYPELIPLMGLAYLVYVAILASRGHVRISSLVKLWLGSLAVAAILINLYLPKLIGALHHQVTHGLGTEQYPPLFGYVLVPAALPGIFGLQTLPPGATAPLLNFTIILAMVAIATLLVIAAVQAWRTSAAAIALLVEVALAVALIVRNSEFGIFKLMLYVQPLLVAVVAVFIARGRPRRLVTGLCLGVIVVLVIVQLSTQQAYVRASRDPIDALNVSAADFIPEFRTLASGSAPIVSVTANSFLIKLEAASSEGHVVLFQSRDVFSGFLSGFAAHSSGKAHTDAERAIRSGPWRPRSFALHNGDGAQDRFEEDAPAVQALNSGNCELALTGPSSEPLNRYALPATAPNLVSMPCDSAHGLLAFVSSNLGEDFYLPFVRRNVSFFQLQPDPYFRGRTMAGFGRYALFAILGYSPGDRLVIELTDTLMHNAVNSLPPASVVGSSRVRLPLEGRGSARVFSAPLRPQLIDGIPYILVDMGVEGALPPNERSGLQALYGKSVPLDTRYLTTYVRDISLVSSAQYAALRPPLALSSFPTSLEDPDLEYSGLYEDGWVGRESFVKLAEGPAAELVVKGEVPTGAGKNLVILIDGHVVAARAIGAGPLDVRVPVAASHSDRRVELSFGAAIHLKAPDLRPAAARLTFLGLVDRR